MENKKLEPEAVMERLGEESSFKYTLSKKVKVGNEEYSELTLNFDTLTGADMEAVAALPGCNSGDMNVVEFSKTYLLNIVARASGVNINILRKFSIADCTALTMKAQAFLMGAVSKVI